MGRKLRYFGPRGRAGIERLHNGGAPAAVIAEKAGSHVATIYRELPNGYTGTADEYGRRVYSAEAAQRTFERNIKRRGERGKLTERGIAIPWIKNRPRAPAYRRRRKCLSRCIKSLSLLHHQAERTAPFAWRRHKKPGFLYERRMWGLALPRGT